MMTVPRDFADSIVRVSLSGSSGTGFFVSPGIVLTCAHVSRHGTGTRVVVEYDGQRLDGIVVAQSPEHIGSNVFAPYPDLAVIHVVNPPTHPCVILDSGMPSNEARLYTVGYTTTLPGKVGFEPATFTYVGPHEVQDGSFLKLSTGEAVGGMSGGPLLDLERGVVCGVMKTSRAPDTDRGGWATPVTAAERVYPGLLKANQTFHSDSPDVHRILRDYAETLKALLPQQYPKKLNTIRLASDMTVAVVQDVWNVTNDYDIGLYSSYRGRGEEVHNAFAALHSSPGVSVLLGDPGGGKTTILAGYCAYTILHHAKLALFVRIPDLVMAAARCHLSTSIDALELVTREWASQFGIEHSPATSASLMRRLVESGEAIIALDGLDEVHSPSLRGTAAQLIHLLAESPAKLLISSRLTGYSPLAVASKTYFVMPFEVGGTEDFARLWFADRAEAEAADAQLERALRAMKDSRLADACRTPVVAGLVCIVAETQEIRDSVSGLYHQYVNLHLRRAWKSPELQRITAAELGQAAKDAQDLAWAMATAPTPNSGPSWLDHVSLSWLIDVAGLEPRVVNLYELDGLLVAFGTAPPNDSLAQEVRWLHRTIHEHLTGWRLRAWLQRDLETALVFLRQSFARSQWRVPHEHMAEQLGDSPVFRSILDRVLDEAYERDTPSQLLAVSALQLSLSSGSAHRLKEMVSYAVRSHSWHALSEFIDAKLVCIEDVTEQIASVPIAPRRYGWGLQRLLRHVPAGPDKITLARHLQERAEDPGEWDSFIVECIAEMEPIRGAQAALDAIDTHNDVFTGVWNQAPDHIGDMLSSALWRTIQQGKRAFRRVLFAVAETDNKNIIDRIRNELITAAEPCPMFVAFLDGYTKHRPLGEELVDLNDSEIRESLGGHWEPEISYILGYCAGYCGRLEESQLTAWVRVGYAAGAADALRSSGTSPKDVIGTFHAFSQLPLPSVPEAALELRRSLEWIREGRAQISEVEAFYRFIFSPGLVTINSNLWILPWFDAAYFHEVRNSIDGLLILELGREKFATLEFSAPSFEPQQVCAIFAEGLGVFLNQRLNDRQDERTRATYRDLFLELVDMLVATESNVDFHHSDMEFYQLLPSAEILDLVSCVCKKLPDFASEDNARQLAEYLERNMLMSDQPAEVFNLLCRESFGLRAVHFA